MFNYLRESLIVRHNVSSDSLDARDEEAGSNHLLGVGDRNSASNLNSGNRNSTRTVVSTN